MRVGAGPLAGGRGRGSERLSMSLCVRAGVRARECAIGVVEAEVAGARMGLDMNRARRPRDRVLLNTGERGGLRFGKGLAHQSIPTNYRHLGDEPIWKGLASRHL